VPQLHALVKETLALEITTLSQTLAPEDVSLQTEHAAPLVSFVTSTKLVWKTHMKLSVPLVLTAGLPENSVALKELANTCSPTETLAPLTTACSVPQEIAMQILPCAKVYQLDKLVLSDMEINATLVCTAKWECWETVLAKTQLLKDNNALHLMNVFQVMFVLSQQQTMYPLADKLEPKLQVNLAEIVCMLADLDISAVQHPTILAKL